MKRRLMSWLFRPIRTAAVGVLIAALAFVLLSSSLAPRLVGLARNAVERLAARTVTTIGGPALVERIQGLNRLETARQVSQHVVESRSEGLPLPEFLAVDKLLMLIQTEAVVGVDLSRLSSHDVRLEGRSAVIRLPEPEVFSVRVNDEHSRVYDRQRGWLVFRPNPDLERQARLKAQADARRGTVDREVMLLARTNAERSLRSLLLPLGLRDVRFQWGVVAPVTDSGGEAASPTG